MQDLTNRGQQTPSPSEADLRIQREWLDQLSEETFTLSENFIDLTLKVKENSPRGELAVALQTLRIALSNPSEFETAITQLMTLTQSTEQTRPSGIACVLLARLYQLGCSPALKVDLVKALEYYMIIAEESGRTEDSFVKACGKLAFNQIKLFATKGRPGAILYLVHYYFKLSKFDEMDRWSAKMPEAHMGVLEKWQHENQVHFRRAELQENSSNILEVTHELCQSMIENADKPEMKAIVCADLIHRVKKIQTDPRCAVPLLRTLIIMLRDDRYDAEMIDELLEIFSLQAFFCNKEWKLPLQESQSNDLYRFFSAAASVVSDLTSHRPRYAVTIAQFYLSIIESDKKQFESMLENLEQNESEMSVWRDCMEFLIYAAETPQQSEIPPFLLDHQNFRDRVDTLKESMKRFNRGPE